MPLGGDFPDGLERLAAEIVDACGEVRAVLGAGLLEDVYRAALEAELSLRGIPFEGGRRIQVRYKGRPLGKWYQPDLIVDNAIVLELKAVTEVHPVFHAQLLTYLRLTGIEIGFLVNFHAIPFRTGITRKVLTRIA